MQKAHLDTKTRLLLGHNFYRVKNDVHGNPRYVIHWLAFGSDYDTAKQTANSLGFSVYRGLDFGGGFVGQSYNVENTAENIIKARDAQ